MTALSALAASFLALALCHVFINLSSSSRILITKVQRGLHFMEPNETVILLAEDDAAVRNLVALMLSKEGYAVLTANDGQEALEICDKFTDPIHMLLTDVRMPRMSG